MIISSMLTHNFRLLANKLTKITAYVPMAVIVISTMAIGYGCDQNHSKEVDLKILDLQSTNSDSEYKVTGTTNLPDSSIITVTAVRHLTPATAKKRAQTNINANMIRSILDRDNVEVQAGKWEAELNLSQVAPDGNYREPWQVDGRNSKLTPDKKVTFFATFNPASQWRRSDGKNLEKAEIKVNKLQGNLVSFTKEGEQFVQASKTLPVALPVAKTTPPVAKPEDMNNGWGNRYQLNRRVSTSKTPLPAATEIESQTNTALKASQYLR